MRLRPILETGEQIYNWLKEHFEYEPTYALGFNEKVPIMSKPQVIIFPIEKGQLLLGYLADNDKLDRGMSNNGEIRVLTNLWGCDIYISGYTEEIEIF